MASARTTYQEAARELLRQTVFAAAREQLEERAWAQITMADIAAAAGVSRQTLYNEFGNRGEFGLAFVIHEGERFLDEVEAAVKEHLDDPRTAVSAALEHFLRSAGEDPLIRILLRDDGDGGMLPFVTTRGVPVVEWATARLVAVIGEGWPHASAAEVRPLCETLVRLAISHITTPSAPPRQAATAVTDLLGPFIDRALVAPA
jgi:AcrR family transcriptional regulator